MKRKDFLFSLIAAPIAFVAGVRSYRGVPPVVVPRSGTVTGRWSGRLPNTAELERDIMPKHLVSRKHVRRQEDGYYTFRSAADAEQLVGIVWPYSDAVYPAPFRTRRIGDK